MSATLAFVTPQPTDATNRWPGVRASYRAAGLHWRGVVRIERRVVWECPHVHRNRDTSSLTNGQAATTCARGALIWAGSGAERCEEYRRGCQQANTVSLQPYDPTEMLRLAAELEVLLDREAS